MRVRWRDCLLQTQAASGRIRNNYPRLHTWEDLAELHGRRARVVEYPGWYLDDVGKLALHGYVPGPDGIVRPGVY